MFAELVINIEAALQGTFHYQVPSDLRPHLRVGHLVEVEFGRRLAQGIIIRLDETAPIEETKPIISMVKEEPVVWPWQIDLAQWMSKRYLAPLNACLRLMLPPGLTRWSDISVDINPSWDGTGRLTELQQKIIDLLKDKADLRGRQIGRALPKTDWKTAIDQLARRGILRKASVLDPPRARPKQVRTAELIASWDRIWAVSARIGRKNMQAAVLDHLANLDDPLPAEESVLKATGATPADLNALEAAALVARIPGQTLIASTTRFEEVPHEFQELIGRLPAPVSRLQDEFPAELLSRLESQGMIGRIEQVAALSLSVSSEEALRHVMRLRGASVYYEVLSLLAMEARPVSVSEIYAAAAATSYHLRRLVELDLVRLGSEEVWRDPLADRDYAPATAPRLTIDQARAWGRVKMALVEAIDEDVISAEETDPPRERSEPSERPTLRPFLLHGVTGSGKTEIYMRAIEFALQQGKQSIVLVPEIALTPQTVRRFAARFPGRVAVLHSRLSEGERFDTWRRARRGLFDIVIGPRSALFTPLPRLAVIAIDEEHDQSYKQGPPVQPPYYHAREVAAELGRINDAVVIMGSATPDLVVYHHARAGRYQLLELPKRVMGHRQRIESQVARLKIETAYHKATDDPEDALTIPLPPIQVVDLRQELRAGNRSIFSRALEKLINETLEKGEQAILFLNRRGTASFVICRDCGYVQTCRRCDLPMTYHRPQSALVCHHCGRREPQRELCPQCGSKRIRFFGIGTEEVEERVQAHWPQARITRWDRDTTAGKHAHEQLLADFINHKADILVGTQMIAKGLDLPLVTLVGVISADVSLGLPDYWTAERAFQLLSQVAGRAGRGLLGGKVIIQTYQPDHYAIAAAADHDYASFYIDEIRFRTQHGLPPFRRLARLLYQDPVLEKGRREAERLARSLRAHSRTLAMAATEILGPVPPFFQRIDGRYRWQIIVRSPDPSKLLADFPPQAQWMIDIDPVNTL